MVEVVDLIALEEAVDLVDKTASADLEITQEVLATTQEVLATTKEDLETTKVDLEIDTTG